MPSALNATHFADEASAYRWVEERVWPDGRLCPHCGTIGESGSLKGKSTRIGVYKCYACRKPFTVKVRTIFESSHIPLHIWLQAMFLMCSSKKGVSANQLHRTLGVTLKSAWFLAHRIREAMRDDGSSGPLGGEGKIVEADATFLGPSAPVETSKKSGRRKSPGLRGKVPVLTLVERNGRSRSFKADELTSESIQEILAANASRASRLHTDEARAFRKAGKDFASHETVNHGEEEYARDDVTTNTVEGFFSVFKRGMRGIYQQCGEQHLQRYLAEFDFRYSHRAALGVDDMERTEKVISGIIGRRLTYR
jgi:transposase-like protein